MSVDGRIPIDIVTGFLGAGKTTLLRRAMADEDAGATAVLVNEFGEVGLDQLMFERIAPDVVLLDSGCVCCQVRGEVRDAVVSLIERRAAGAIPPFRRIVLETSGLAEPAPLLSTFMADPALGARTSVRRIVAVVDALTVAAGAAGAARPPEWLAQTVAADAIALSKLDLVEPEQEAAVRAEIARLNPTATVFAASAPEAMATVVGAQGFGRPTPAGAPAPAADHGDIDSAWLRRTTPIDWPSLGVWLSGMLHFHGDKVLRLKGLIDIGGAGPLLLNGVQHVMHRPEHLDAWPDADRTSRILVIARGLDAAGVVAEMTAFLDRVEAGAR